MCRNHVDGEILCGTQTEETPGVKDAVACFLVVIRNRDDISTTQPW